jgi:chemotaxis protein methyltransferase CheR
MTTTANFGAHRRLSPGNFAWLADFLKAQSGLVLGPDKEYLLDSRLSPIARHEGCAGLDPLVAKLRAAPAGPLAATVIEAMTTNESFFFRDSKPFEHFRAMLPALCAARQRRVGLRIWSAACSTGQEAYSLAMILSEAKAVLNGREVEIVGTDLSLDVLTRAREGLYTQFEVQRGLPVAQLVKHFRKDGAYWRISDDLRAMVSWRRFNLLDPPAPLGRFDVVFCRNVLIYFDQPTKARVLDRIAGLMPPDGLLYLGAAETVLGITEKFEPLAGQRGAYALATPALATPALTQASTAEAFGRQPPATGGAAATAMPTRPLSANVGPPAGLAGMGAAGRAIGAAAIGGGAKAAVFAVGSRST